MTASAGYPKSPTHPRAQLCGVVFDLLSEAEAAQLVLDGFRSGTGGRVVTPNVDIVRQASADPELARLVQESDLVLVDGMPLVWAMRLQGIEVPERVAGSSLAARLVEGAAGEGVRLFLLGGNPGVAQRAAQLLSKRHLSLEVGWHCPPFGYEANPAALEEIFVALERFGPCVCLMGLPFPKQERLAAQLARRCPQSWFVGTGAAIGFLAGEVPRAPQWVQRMGLEWAHRLVHEPRRLAERYLRWDLPFAVGLLAQSVARSPRLRAHRRG